MFDHIGFGVTDLDASKNFFLEALEPIGVSVAMEGPYGVGLGQERQAVALVPRDGGQAGAVASGVYGEEPATGGCLLPRRVGCRR